jgi:hypothetical protein
MTLMAMTDIKIPDLSTVTNPEMVGSYTMKSIVCEFDGDVTWW